jgi:uncharacterized membrane-anchored protein
MNLIASPTFRVAAAALASLALVPVAVAGPLSARLTGEEYLLEVAPVDPVDPFRGAYVALEYPGLPHGRPAPESWEGAEEFERSEGAEGSEGYEEHDRSTSGEVVYVPLQRSGEVWVGLTPVSRPPASGPFLRCNDEYWRLRCGIESWFLPQDEAYALEQEVRQGRVVARIRVDSRGNAALVDVEPVD